MEAYIPGATAVGIAFKDGVILGAERRITLGNYVISKSGKKVFKVTENVGVVCAGMIADMQNLVREVSTYAKLKELESRRFLKPNSVAKLMSVLMFERRYAPLLTQVILGGVGNKPLVYVLDPLGSVISDEYAAVGTGAEMQRDAMSGNGLDLLSVDASGIKEEAINL